MTLENKQAPEDANEAEKAAEATTEAQTGTDWKAEARKWEARAKENSKAAEELAALKAAQMTEAEKATAHLAEVESELAALKADAQRRTDAAEVAKATGVPASLLEYCATREAMEAFASEYGSAAGKPAGAPAAEQSRITRGGAKPAPADDFAAYMQNLMNQRSI